MTKSSVDRKRSKYGEKYSLRFHKRLKTYDLTCNDETPHLIAKFVETDGDLAMRLFERLESNYKENEQLKLQYKELEISLLNNQLAYNDLEKENEQLKFNIQDMQTGTYINARNIIRELKEENEQLKSELRNLRRLANELYMEGSE